jgi:predicted secreted protein
MSPAVIELLFWIVVFAVLFYGLRRLQKRRGARSGDGAGGSGPSGDGCDGGGDGGD